MGPTRKRDLAATAMIAAVIAYVLVIGLYRWFPPVTVWTGLSLLLVAAAEAGWAVYVRSKIADGEIGAVRRWLHPLAVARSVMVAKASAWVGTVVFGWWIGVVVFLLARRGELRVASDDTTGAAVAAISALALVIAALWLQHCCKSPGDPPNDPDDAFD